MPYCELIEVESSEKKINSLIIALSKLKKENNAESDEAELCFDWVIAYVRFRQSWYFKVNFSLIVKLIIHKK